MFGFLSSKERVKKNTEKHLEQYSRPSVDFFTLIALSTSIVTVGLVLNNAAIIIGAMVVAPLITPLFGFSLNLILTNWKGVGRSLLSILTGTALAVFMAIFFAFIIIVVQEGRLGSTAEIISRTKPDLLYFIVAILSGAAGSFAYARKNLSEKIVGIAISAAIIPPLGVMGLSIAIKNWGALESSTILYLLNLIGICFGSIIMFLILGYGKEEELEIKK
ncbi:MAG: TIGR00341 family protein [Candidatus Magasanikbacteria bacterium]|jgi:uncharacterized hydrophobic protein (TIGR00271 family)|nr:TIGR00341 family protein [Candidatus Magasanikbacteria bacterium]MBT4314600.1 TIGR00341 family protein [Candidatus Magasanikbacteria bacterium]MBT4546767.1 TIGR00341 family protein [Candidatus Magasanikbacteria bacterium]MBT6819624.1 TIGR00341 family protein [Candidatus Magasanikbacteria bacterium]